MGRKTFPPKNKKNGLLNGRDNGEHYIDLITISRIFVTWGAFCFFQQNDLIGDVFASSRAFIFQTGLFDRVLTGFRSKDKWAPCRRYSKYRCEGSYIPLDFYTCDCDFPFCWKGQYVMLGSNIMKISIMMGRECDVCEFSMFLWLWLTDLQNFKAK